MWKGLWLVLSKKATNHLSTVNCCSIQAYMMNKIHLEEKDLKVYYRVNKIQRQRTYFTIMETDSIIMKLSTPCIAVVDHFFHVYYINYI